MPTIRIDDEVYAWLQKQARPFEDTPNSVLRRIANIECPVVTDPARSRPENVDDVTVEPAMSETSSTTKLQNRNSGRRPPLANARRLSQEWNVRVRHALFHRDGCWYNNLERFPGALFDPDGYVRFETEEQYLNSQYLNVSKQTNVPNSISSIPGKRSRLLYQQPSRWQPG